MRGARVEQIGLLRKVDDVAIQRRVEACKDRAGLGGGQQLRAAVGGVAFALHVAGLGEGGHLAARDRQVHAEALGDLGHADGTVHLDDAEGVATYTGNLAQLALDRTDWVEAETLSRDALRLAEKIGRQQLIARDCERLAVALVRHVDVVDNHT